MFMKGLSSFLSVEQATWLSGGLGASKEQVRGSEFKWIKLDYKGEWKGMITHFWRINMRIYYGKDLL